MSAPSRYELLTLSAMDIRPMDNRKIIISSAFSVCCGGVRGKMTLPSSGGTTAIAKTPTITSRSTADTTGMSRSLILSSSRDWSSESRTTAMTSSISPAATMTCPDGMLSVLPDLRTPSTMASDVGWSTHPAASAARKLKPNAKPKPNPIPSGRAVSVKATAVELCLGIPLELCLHVGS